MVCCLQALLHEMLLSTGAVHTPADQPSHKRLACYVTLIKQLLQAGVFGPLQVLTRHQFGLPTCLPATFACLTFHLHPVHACNAACVPSSWC